MPLGVLKNSKPELIQGRSYPGIYYMLRAGERADRKQGLYKIAYFQQMPEASGFCKAYPVQK